MIALAATASQQPILEVVDGEAVYPVDAETITRASERALDELARIIFELSDDEEPRQ